MITKQQKINNENLARDCKGNFINEAKLEDSLKSMSRPLVDKEKEMIEKFLKERENERVSMGKL